MPEFWEEFSKETGIVELMKTTRDVSNYDELMQMRMDVLNKNNFKIQDIKKVADRMQPLKGARKFLDWLRERAQVVILTGSYYEYIMPLIEQLGYPFMCANNLKIEDGKIVGYKLREKDGKIEMIERFRQAGFETIAIGDSLNDLKMLHGADKGILFRAKQELVKKEKGKLDSARDYKELKEILEKYLN